MVIHESEQDEQFSDLSTWGVYEAMSGSQQAAHRGKLGRDDCRRFTERWRKLKNLGF